MYMADTDFVDVPLKGLTSKQYARDQFALIDMNKARQEEAIEQGQAGGGHR
jgi:gamma-glutamyltranspeptidase/glutathione hydrolase